MQTKIQVVMFSFVLCEGSKQWTCILLVTCPKHENGEILITHVTLDYQLKELKFTHSYCLVGLWPPKFELGKLQQCHFK